MSGEPARTNPQGAGASDLGPTPEAGSLLATADPGGRPLLQRDSQPDAPNAHPHPRRWPRARRWFRRGLAAIALLIAGVLLVDAIIAGRVEHNISQRIYDNSNLATPPRVTVAGYPYIAAALTGEIQAVTVGSRDVHVPGYGLLSVQTSAQYITVPRSAVWSGDFENAPARKVFTRLQLDGVSLGARMGINDLLIQNKDDISPLGGWETEALFEGTPKEFHRPATVQVKLRLREGDVYITAEKVVKGPTSSSVHARTVPGSELDPQTRDRLLEEFSLMLPARDLPLGGETPMRVYVSGGSVYVESEKYYTTVSLLDLTPPSRPLSKEEQPRL